MSPLNGRALWLCPLKYGRLYKVYWELWLKRDNHNTINNKTNLYYAQKMLTVTIWLKKPCRIQGKGGNGRKTDSRERQHGPNQPSCLPLAGTFKDTRNQATAPSYGQGLCGWKCGIVYNKIMFCRPPVKAALPPARMWKDGTDKWNVGSTCTQPFLQRPVWKGAGVESKWRDGQSETKRQK